MRVLVFDIDGNRYGLDATHVREVLPAATLTGLATAPPAIKGILDVHGMIVPIVDARRTLGLEAREVRQSDHFVIVYVTGRTIGLHVDHAVEIIEVDDESLDNGNEFLERSMGTQCIARFDGRLLPVQLLDAIVGGAGSITVTPQDATPGGGTTSNVTDA